MPPVKERATSRSVTAHVAGHAITALHFVNDTQLISGDLAGGVTVHSFANTLGLARVSSVTLHQASDTAVCNLLTLQHQLVVIFADRLVAHDKQFKVLYTIKTNADVSFGDALVAGQKLLVAVGNSVTMYLQNGKSLVAGESLQLDASVISLKMLRGGTFCVAVTANGHLTFIEVTADRVTKIQHCRLGTAVPVSPFLIGGIASWSQTVHVYKSRLMVLGDNCIWLGTLPPFADVLDAFTEVHGHRRALDMLSGMLGGDNSVIFADMGMLSQEHYSRDIDAQLLKYVDHAVTPDIARMNEGFDMRFVIEDILMRCHKLDKVIVFYDTLLPRLDKAGLRVLVYEVLSELICNTKLLVPS